MNSQRGVALVLAMLATSFLSAVGLGLAVMVFMDRLASGNMRGSVGLLHAAEAGVELAAHDLARTDWNAVLAGLAHASFSDGSPTGVRVIPGGGEVNLATETNEINCGSPSSCTAAQMTADTAARPWGVNNPHWRLFAYGPLAGITAVVQPTACYLAVWVADDVRERDGDPLVDGEGHGRGVLRVRAVAFGPSGSRRAVEAELARVCSGAGGEEVCRPGIRVQSWREVRQLIP
jgi:hypothetical protein